MAGLRLEHLPNFNIGHVRVSPAARLIESESGSFTTEPLVMQLLVELSRNAGRVVSRRDIFDRCWGSAAVGDDSLNRIVASLRKALSKADGGSVRIDTVPGAGYALRIRASPGERPFARASTGSRVDEACREGLDSIRLGWPEPDNLRIEQLRSAVAAEPADASAWGMLALLTRYAAEYALPGESGDFVVECEESARRALELDGRQPQALVALATVAPLFGRWTDAIARLGQVLARTPGDFTANHEQVIADMATGRVGAAVARLDRLIAADPLAACLVYKGVYQHWSRGNLIGMDQLADRGVHLWPTHPAIWTARLWTLAFTGRIEAALAMVDDEAARPAVPPPALRLLRMVLSAAANGSANALDEAAAVAGQAAQTGPAQAITALFALGLLQRTDDAFALAGAYYLRSGKGPVPVRHTDGEPSVNDQHRRVTQILFTPACAAMRDDARFARLCERVGLLAHWQQTGLAPDFMA